MEEKEAGEEEEEEWNHSKISSARKSIPLNMKRSKCPEMCYTSRDIIVSG